MPLLTIFADLLPNTPWNKRVPTEAPALIDPVNILNGNAAIFNCACIARLRKDLPPLLIRLVAPSNLRKMLDLRLTSCSVS